MAFEILGILSALVFLAGDVPYLSDTIKGKTKPHRITWGVVTLLNVIGFANQWASGASNSLWLFGAGVLMVGAIFIASLWKGVGGHTRQDMVSLTISLIGVGLWLIFDSPLLSILANILVAAVALLPSYAKAKRAPETETGIAWIGGAVSSLLAAISVGELNPQLLLLPVAAVFFNGYMVYILYFMGRGTDKGLTR
jgi:hypothetical protein